MLVRDRVRLQGHPDPLIQLSPGSPSFVPVAGQRATGARATLRRQCGFARGLPFEHQFFLDVEGERHIVSNSDWLESWDVSWEPNEPTWWSMDDDGRMHFFGEDRVEVLPRIRSKEAPPASG